MNRLVGAAVAVVLASGCSGSGGSSAGASSGGSSSSGSTSGGSSGASSGSSGSSGSSAGASSSSSSSGSGGSSGSSTHGTPTSFLALSNTQGAGRIAVDGANRVFAWKGGTMAYMEDGASAWTDVSLANDGIHAPCGAGNLSTGPDGAVWASCAPGKHVFKRGTGDAHWADVSDGFPAGLSDFGTYLGAVGFDAAGAGYVLAYTSADTVQLYQLPAGSSTWQAYGPVSAAGSISGPPGALAVGPDGTVYFAVGRLHSLAPGANAFTTENSDQTTDIVRTADGTVYAEVGIGSGTRVTRRTGPAAWTDVTALGTSGHGVTDPGGLCQTGTGALYAVTTPDSSLGGSGIWELGGGAFTQVPLAPAPSGDATASACAPNGRLYVVYSQIVNRSQP